MKKVNSLKPYKRTGFTIRRSSKVFDSTIEKSSKPSKPSKPSEPCEQGLAPGDRAAVRVKELTVENIYDDIKFLKNKLKDNNLTVSEYRKISDDMDQLRISLLNEQMELEDDKKN